MLPAASQTRTIPQGDFVDLDGQDDVALALAAPLLAAGRAHWSASSSSGYRQRTSLGLDWNRVHSRRVARPQVAHDPATE
jgi:hypothetical protein